MYCWTQFCESLITAGTLKFVDVQVFFWQVYFVVCVCVFFAKEHEVNTGTSCPFACLHASSPAPFIMFQLMLSEFHVASYQVHLTFLRLLPLT